MKKTSLIVVIAAAGVMLITAVAAAHEFRPAQTLDDARAAACRISTPNARGTGTFNGIDRANGWAVISTCYHVVTNNTEVTLDFWTNSTQESIKGRVYARYYDTNIPLDAALIKVDPEKLAAIDPPYVPLAGRDGAPAADSYILSAGCPKGRYVNAWRGKVIGYYAGRTIEFQPPPVPGQSGSAIVSFIDGRLWQTGILTWLIGPEGVDTSKGGAIPIANLYEAQARRAGQIDAAAPADYASPIPPGATECAEPVSWPYVIEFTRDNCPACVDAQKDVDALRAARARLEIVNASTPEGAARAERFNVTAAPTWIVFNAAGVESARHIGAGVYQTIYKELNELIEKAKEKEQAPPPPTVDDTPGALELVIDAAPPAPGPAEPEKPLEPAYCPLTPAPPAGAYDFRRRPAVYEQDITAVDFFDDSDAAWRTHRGKKAEPRQDPETGRDDDDETNKERPGRLRDKLSGGIDSAIDGAVEKAAGVIDEKIAAKEKAIEARLNALKTRLFVALLIIGVIACIIADTIRFILRAAWRWARRAWDNAVAAAAAEPNKKQG